MLLAHLSFVTSTAHARIVLQRDFIIDRISANNTGNRSNASRYVLFYRDRIIRRSVDVYRDNGKTISGSSYISSLQLLNDCCLKPCVCPSPRQLRHDITTRRPAILPPTCVARCYVSLVTQFNASSRVFRKKNVLYYASFVCVLSQVWLDGVRSITHNVKANNVCPLTCLKKQ